MIPEPDWLFGIYLRRASIYGTNEMDSESTHENSSIKNVEECDPRCSFRGPENSSWRHNPDELKRIHINIVRKQSSSVSSTSLDPQLIAPVRRPDEGKVPLFSKIPVHSVDSGGQDEEKASRGAKNRKRETSPAKKERRILSGRRSRNEIRRRRSRSPSPSPSASSPDSSSRKRSRSKSSSSGRSRKSRSRSRRRDRRRRSGSRRRKTRLSGRVSSPDDRPEPPPSWEGRPRPPFLPMMPMYPPLMWPYFLPGPRRMPFYPAPPMTYRPPFFVHRGMPRQGPGTPLRFPRPGPSRL